MVLKADHILEAERFAELGGQFHGLVIDRIGPVEADEWGSPIVAAEELRHGHDPQGVIGIVRTEEDRDLELDIDAQTIEQEAK